VEAEVLAAIREYGKAMRAGYLVALLALYSEDWEDNHGAAKDSLEGRYRGMRAKRGYEEIRSLGPCV